MENIHESSRLKKGDLIESNHKKYIIIGQDYGVVNSEKGDELPLNEIDKKIIELIKSKQEVNLSGEDSHDDFKEDPVHDCNDIDCVDFDTDITNYISKVVEDINNFGNNSKYEKNWDKEYLLGFYRSFHRFSDNWGIYLKASGQARRVRRLYQSIQANTPRYGNLSIESCYIISKTFTFYHEYYHHKVETLATRIEVITRKPHYMLGFHCLYCNTFGSDSCLEEAFAHTSAYFDSVRNLNNLLDPMGLTKRQLKHILRELIIRDSPPGYNMAFQITAADDENEAARLEHYFFEALLRYSYKLNYGTSLTEMDEAYWSYFTHSTHPFVNTNNNITYVVDFDETTIVQIRNLFGL